MLETARQQFDVFAKLGNAQTNAPLRAQLKAKLARETPTPEALAMQVNLARRSGDLAATRSAIVELARLNGETGDFSENAIVPFGLENPTGQKLAPLIVIDDFLQPDQMNALHRHACDTEDEFRKANTNSQSPAYDPDKRETLVNWHFTEMRDHFEEFIEQNLAEFQCILGLPAFVKERMELKMTCHIDGGFFRVHADNHEPITEAGRAITWLYYFGEQTPRYTGGELFLLDTELATGVRSTVWFTKVEPKPNRLVAFPSWFYHAVGPTQVECGEFGAGRFAISSHIRKPADGLGWSTEW